MKDQSTVKVFWIYTIVVLAIGFGLGWWARGSDKPVSAQAAFSHENCQYPDRWTNPVDGCDNSDPAVPECIKASYSQEAEKQCQDEFVAAHQGTAEKQEAIAEHSKPFEEQTNDTNCPAGK